MIHEEYYKALAETREIHKKLQKEINTSVKDLKLMIYYLQGGCITQAFMAIKAWENGDLNTPIRAKRFIDECKQTILCLLVLNKTDRFVKRFFEDEIITIDPAKYKKEILSKLSMSEADFDTWIGHSENIGHGFSKGVHPHLKAVAYNSDMDTGEYDYEGVNFPFYPIDNFDFAHFILIPVIDAVTLPSHIFNIKNEEYERLNNLREKIQKIAISLHSLSF